MTDKPTPRHDPIGPEPEKPDHSRTMLVGYIRRVLEHREIVRDENSAKAETKKAAKDDGFDPVKIEEVCRWIEKIDKHGRDAMDEAEAIYDLYRQVYDGQGKSLSEIMDDARDRALVAQFAAQPEEKVKAPTQKQKAAADALAYTAVAKMNRGIR